MLNAVKNKLTNFKHFTALGLSILYGFYLLYPLTPWLRLNNYSEKPLPFFPYSDTSFYLLQIKFLIDNEGNYRNPYFYEHSDSVMSISDSYFIWVWSAFARLLSLDAIQVYILLMFITGLVTYLVIYTIFNGLKLTFAKSNLISAITTFWLLPIVAMGRPSPTQTTLWIVLLCVFRLSKHVSMRNSVFPWDIVFILSILFLFNGIYALYICTFAFLLAIFYPDFRKKYIYFIFPTSLLGAYYTTLTKFVTSIESKDLRNRLGFLDTHLPGSLRLTILTVLIGSLLVIINNFNDNVKIYSIAIFALPIAANQNVLSGKWWQPEAHYWFLMIVLIAVGSYVLFCYFLEKIRISKLYFYSKSLFVLILFFGLLQVFHNANDLKNQTEKGSRLNNEKFTILQQLKYSGIKNQVVLESSETGSVNLPEEVLLLTDTFLYWNSLGGLYESTNTEILERFACTINKEDYTYSDLTKDSRKIYIYRFLNPDMFFPKWNHLSDTVKLIERYSSPKDNILKIDHTKLVKYRVNSCDPYKYKVDWILTKEGKLLRVRM